MSRVGKKPIEVPSGVKLQMGDGKMLVQGPKGKLEAPVPSEITLEVKDGVVEAKRDSESPRARSLHGLTRTLVANAILGVSQGFSKELDVIGIGYRAQVEGKTLKMALGLSHPVDVPFPAGIEMRVEKAQRTISNYVATIIVSGIDKARVGQMAADLRKLRPPDAYKGKGIRYAHEQIKLKVGKKGA